MRNKSHRHEPELDPQERIVEEAAAPPAEVAPGAAFVVEVEEAMAAAEDRLLRLAAEFDNFRRRTQKEKAEAADRGAMAVVSRLLDALDDFDRLDSSDPGTGTADAFREAFHLVKRKLQQSLEAAGLERLVPSEVPFDPTEHEAVSVVPPERPEQDHLVKMTLQTGYRFKGFVIRPARVQVYSEQGTA